jgi:hypothetical protein
VALDTDQLVGPKYRMICLPTSTWIDANGRIVDRVVRRTRAKRRLGGR